LSEVSLSPLQCLFPKLTTHFINKIFNLFILLLKKVLQKNKITQHCVSWPGLLSLHHVLWVGPYCHKWQYLLFQRLIFPFTGWFCTLAVVNTGCRHLYGLVIRKKDLKQLKNFRKEKQVEYMLLDF
jgi:hypothetical protein